MSTLLNFPPKKQNWINVSFLLAVLISNFGFANNVKVENVSITNQNDATNVKDIKFDISWDNSWRTSASPSNWDACWVFAKYRLTSGTNWNHATLSSTNSDHTAPSGSEIDAVTDGKGIFIFRNADGNGNNNWDNARLRWNYGVDGLLDNDSVEICVFAIEMVYVPQGDFYLGDGNGSLMSTYSFYNHSLANTAALISSAPIRVRSSGVGDAPILTNGVYMDGDGGLDLNGNGSFADAGDNANFPIGYKATYCMKYEITQGEYVEFANKLNAAQGANILAASTTYRMNLFGSGNNWSTTTPNRPTTLSCQQIMAYLDWTALRPITETEFEKFCRGPLPAIYQEYSWGNTNLYSTPYNLSLDGTGSEGIINPGVNLGNANYGVTTSGSTYGPFRSGIFAASSPNHTREETGGSYYGIMELSGNLCEIAVYIGDPDGRKFDGANGDGMVHSSGFADVNTWPFYAVSPGNNTTLDYGMCVRGGSWVWASSYMRVSDRQQYNTNPTGISNLYYYGGRGVRNP